MTEFVVSVVVTFVIVLISVLVGYGLGVRRNQNLDE
jgi:ABC-type glycerol-3-phosphate transport system permease component